MPPPKCGPRHRVAQDLHWLDTDPAICSNTRAKIAGVPKLPAGRPRSFPVRANSKLLLSYVGAAEARIGEWLLVNPHIAINNRLHLHAGVTDGIGVSQEEI